MLPRHVICLSATLICILGGCPPATIAQFIPQTASTSINAENALQQGLSQAEQGNYEAAIAAYTQALRLNPTRAAAFYQRGVARFYLRQTLPALNDYNQALQRDPNFADAYIARGIVRYELGGTPGAIEDFTQAIRLQPRHATAYYYRGIASLDPKLPTSNPERLRSAIADFTQAIQLDPSFVDAYSYQGLSHYRLRDLPAAKDDFSQVIQLNPGDDWAYYRRGLIRSELQDYSGAIADYDQAIRLNPDWNPFVYRDRGKTRKYLGLAGAEEDFATFQQIYPLIFGTSASSRPSENPDVYYQQGIELLKRGMKREAKKRFERAVALYQSRGNVSGRTRAMQQLKKTK
ncbi:tetratricopeptide repeat protein [Trichocoleus sp. FACHB-46]|nr:tetratricopeptide repeat protein [Trichocoleus sp. FACHB-46]